MEVPQNHGPWEILQRNLVYQDPWLRVEQDDVKRPDGRPGTYCVAHLKPGVCVIAVDQNRNAHLTSEFHYGVGRVTIEGVSGGIDYGEEPLIAAKRELAEELGLTARTWIELGTVDPFTSNVVSPTQLFLALGISRGESTPEGTELIQHVEMPLREAVRRVCCSEITHAPTCDALLRSAMHLGILAFANDADSDSLVH